jgi:hypothetical protein
VMRTAPATLHVVLTTPLLYSVMLRLQCTLHHECRRPQATTAPRTTPPSVSRACSRRCGTLALAPSCAACTAASCAVSCALQVVHGHCHQRRLRVRPTPPAAVGPVALLQPLTASLIAVVCACVRACVRVCTSVTPLPAAM